MSHINTQQKISHFRDCLHQLSGGQQHKQHKLGNMYKTRINHKNQFSARLNNSNSHLRLNHIKVKQQ
jgi:hypothetical protein